jgi:hypothetical protein
MGNNGGKAHRRRNPRRSQGQIHWLRTNCQSDRWIEGTWTKVLTRRTQRYPQILPTTHRSKVIARWSYRWSWNRPELRFAIPGVSDLNWGRGFKIRKGLDERIPGIYILLWLEDILFFVIILFLKLKIIPEKGWNRFCYQVFTLRADGLGPPHALRLDFVPCVPHA